MVKNPPTSAGARVQFLDQEDSLEEDMATHSSILDWEIPRTEEPCRLGLQSKGHKESDMTEPRKKHQMQECGSERHGQRRLCSISLKNFVLLFKYFFPTLKNKKTNKKKTSSNTCFG